MRIATAELAILQESDEIEKIRLQFALEKANVQADYAAQIEKALTTEERQNLEAAERNDLQRLSLEQNIAITDEIENEPTLFSDQLAHQDELNQLLQGQNDIFADIGQTIQDGLVRGGLKTQITGAKSLREALFGVLKSIGGTLLRSAITSAVGGINFGGGGGGTPEVLTSGINFFAEGGYASGATNAVIGEAGPEYLIPGEQDVKAWRVTRVVSAALLSSPENVKVARKAMGGGTVVLLHQSTFVTPSNVLIALIM